MSDTVHPGLSYLTNPIPTASFLNDYWQQKPLVVKRERPDYFAGLLSVEEVGSIISAPDLPAGAIDLADAHSPADRKEYIHTNGAVDVIRVQQLFSKGATILLNEAHRMTPALALLCRMLEKQFSSPFQANVYMTPPSCQGFKPHYDTHDTFLLQLAGSKKWTICGSPVRLPLPSQPFQADVHEVGAPIVSCELQAGDLLYIPRGFVHYGQSGEVISLHVTLGALIYTWADVFAEVVTELSLVDPGFRRALPEDFARPDFDFASAKAAFIRLLDRAQDERTLRTVLERLADVFVGSRRALVPGQLEQLVNLDNLSLLDEVGPRIGLIYRLRRNGTGLQILCHGREIALPLSADKAIRFALETPRYAIRDLDGDLDEGTKISLMRRLIEEGLVMCYTHSPS